MDETLKAILQGITELKEDIKEVKTEVTELKNEFSEAQETINLKLDSIESISQSHKYDIDFVHKKSSALELQVNRIEKRLDKIQ